MSIKEQIMGVLKVVSTLSPQVL